MLEWCEWSVPKAISSKMETYAKIISNAATSWSVGSSTWTTGSPAPHLRPCWWASVPRYPAMIPTTAGLFQLQSANCSFGERIFTVCGATNSISAHQDTSNTPCYLHQSCRPIKSCIYWRLYIDLTCHLLGQVILLFMTTGCSIKLWRQSLNSLGCTLRPKLFLHLLLTILFKKSKFIILCLFLDLRHSFCYLTSLLFSGSDRACDPAFPVRLMGNTLPAAEAGGGGTFTPASGRPVLPGVCGLHLSVVRLSQEDGFYFVGLDV